MNINVLVFIFSILIYICIYICQILNLMSLEISTQLLIINLCLFYIFLLVKLIRSRGVFSAYTLLIINIFLFNLSRIFLNLVGYGENFYIGSSLVKYNFTIETRFKLICIYTICLYSLNISLLFFRRKKIKKLEQKLIYVNFGKKVMLLFLPFLILRYFKEIKMIFKSGYLVLYTGGLNSINYSLIERLTPTMFFLGYMIFLMGIPPKKKFINYSMLVLSMNIVNAFKGSRGELILTVLYIFWYYSTFYGLKVKFLKVFGYGSIGTLILQLIALKRMDNLDFFNLNILTLPLKFIYLQGQSLLNLAFYIEKKSELSYNIYPYILDPLIYIINLIKHPWIARIGQSEKLLNIRYDLSHHLTFNLNKLYYLDGKNLGANFLSEAYEFGIFGVVIISLLLGYFILKYELLCKSNRIALLYSYVLIKHVIYTPRMNFFINSYIFIRLSVSLAIMILILFFLKRLTNNILED